MRPGRTKLKRTRTSRIRERVVRAAGEDQKRRPTTRKERDACALKASWYSGLSGWVSSVTKKADCVNTALAWASVHFGRAPLFAGAKNAPRSASAATVFTP